MPIHYICCLVFQAVSIGTPLGPAVDRTVSVTSNKFLMLVFKTAVVPALNS